ncbi:hypothetical protein SAMN05216249_1145 [Acetitomaculum ruminis DSM 5522]|uniref:Uncharacterized protein n=1 Tax=Acetitomaculum ruminis DSM 5522 TaxID=1120918 RepID=A0A1I0ZDM6_9FIRM|nr:hypothetical protein [Acetitomaculum ruminis]SFB22518.1 hypothetical protein SAMN05216249_1145 [Acetitomaculum ruminis DSM 5522]
MKHKSIILIPLVIVFFLISFYLMFFVFFKKNILQDLNLTWNTEFVGNATTVAKGDLGPKGEQILLYKISSWGNEAYVKQLNSEGKTIYNNISDKLQEENILDDSKEALEYLKNGKYEVIEKDENSKLYIWNGDKNSLYIFVENI